MSKSLEELERCPGCGSVVTDEGRSYCWKMKVDTNKIGYRYLHGTWGWCYHLGRDVMLSEQTYLDKVREDAQAEDKLRLKLLAELVKKQPSKLEMLNLLVDATLVLNSDMNTLEELDELGLRTPETLDLDI